MKNLFAICSIFLLMAETASANSSHFNPDYEAEKMILDIIGALSGDPRILDLIISAPVSLGEPCCHPAHVIVDPG